MSKAGRPYDTACVERFFPAAKSVYLSERLWYN